MSKYKLTFKLKQHTPIIHFQYDQHGATLRATELKPKLDKFLIEKLGNENYKKGIDIAKEKKWLIGKGDNTALDYKIKIISKDSNSFDIEKNYPNYLGNMGTTIDEKGFVFSKKIIVEIKIFKPELKEKIEQNFSLFLNSTNFGNRTSKGFGCFTLNNNKLDDFEKELSINFKSAYKISLNRNFDIETDHKSLFRKIQDEYKLLKAGDSRKKKESKLRTYVNQFEKPIEWEKPFIKSIIAEYTQQKANIDINNNNFQYVRALLGLADNFEFIQQKINVRFKPKNEEFQRFTSPILYKVFENNIYVLANNKTNLNSIKGEKIVLEFIKSKKVFKKESLEIPNFNFDLSDFLNFALKNSQWKRIKH